MTREVEILTRSAIALAAMEAYRAAALAAQEQEIPNE